MNEDTPPADGAPDTMEDSLRDQSRPAGGAARPYLFIVLEGDRPLSGGARFSLAGVDEVHIGRGDGRGDARVAQVEPGARRLTLQIPSPSLSRLHARLRRVPMGWYLEDAGSRNGTYLNGERVARGLVGPPDLVELGHAFLVVREIEQLANSSDRDLDSADLADEAPGWRTLLPNVAAGLEDLRRVASSASLGVLLVGETGTGKEVLARAIHDCSRRPGPFVAVNCNTLAEGLVESQLFGHVKGAFSGAVADSIGFVRAADRGTLLLDEIGDLGASAQGALLRVLQEREVVPVGRAAAQKVDVRFLATTLRPLDIGAGQTQFRSDLFARLSGFVYTMMPLRERREDLGLLIAMLLRKSGVSESDRPRIAPDLGLALLRHGWPLNVRELEQLLLRTWLLADGGLMSGAPRFVAAGEATRSASAAPASRSLSADDEAMHRQVADALAATGGNISAAARALGKGRIQLHRLMKRLGVDARQFKG